MKERNIKVIIIEPYRGAHICTIKNELLPLQVIVEGYIDVRTLSNEENLIVIYNKDMLMFLEEKDNISEFISGTLIIAGGDSSSGEFISLTDSQIEKYFKIFSGTEEHYLSENKIKYSCTDIPTLTRRIY